MYIACGFRSLYEIEFDSICLRFTHSETAVAADRLGTGHTSSQPCIRSEKFQDMHRCIQPTPLQGQWLPIQNAAWSKIFPSKIFPAREHPSKLDESLPPLLYSTFVPASGIISWPHGERRGEEKPSSQHQRPENLSGCCKISLSA